MEVGISPSVSCADSSLIRGSLGSLEFGGADGIREILEMEEKGWYNRKDYTKMISKTCRRHSIIVNCPLSIVNSTSAGFAGGGALPLQRRLGGNHYEDYSGR